MEGDRLKKYRFPKTLKNQDRWFGFYLDELIPVGVCLAWSLYTGKFLFGIACRGSDFFCIKKVKRTGKYLVTRFSLLVFTHVLIKHF